MKKFAIPLIVALMTCALAGLLGIQVYWVAHAIKLKKQEFQDDVNNALHNVSENYALAYQQHIIDTLLTRRIQRQIVSVNNRMVVIENDHTEGPISVSETANEHEQKFEIRINNNQGGQGVREEIQVRVNSNPEASVEIVQHNIRGIEENEVYISQNINDAIHELKEEKVVLQHELRETLSEFEEDQEVIQNEINETINELEGLTHQAEQFTNFIWLLKMHESKLDSGLLDSMLDSEMIHHRFPSQYHYKIAQGSARAPLPNPADIFPEATTTVFHTRLKAHNRFGPGPVLYLHFPGQQSHLFKNMAGALSLSGFLILIIIGCFAFAVTAFRKHKKLSELKTDFINNMSHELKTPISTISLASEALSDPDLISERSRVQHFAGIIFEENQRLKQQVERVLQMGRMDKGELKLKKSDFDLHDVIRKEIERISPALQARNGSLAIEFEGTVSQMFADRVHLSGVVQNLLDNAMKYSPEAPKLRVSTHNEGDKVVLKVADQGIGMSKEVQKRIFDKFYRAQTGNRHDVKGFGLGLSYVSLMTKAHGGDISLKSEPGVGSEFTLYFPL